MIISRRRRRRRRRRRWWWWWHWDGKIRQKMVLCSASSDGGLFRTVLLKSCCSNSWSSSSSEEEENKRRRCWDSITSPHTYFEICLRFQSVLQDLLFTQKKERKKERKREREIDIFSNCKEMNLKLGMIVISVVKLVSWYASTRGNYNTSSAASRLLQVQIGRHHWRFEQRSDHRGVQEELEKNSSRDIWSRWWRRRFTAQLPPQGRCRCAASAASYSSPSSLLLLDHILEQLWRRAKLLQEQEQEQQQQKALAAAQWSQQQARAVQVTEPAGGCCRKQLLRELACKIWVARRRSSTLKLSTVARALFWTLPS